MNSITDTLALLITADVAGAVRGIERVGTTAERELGKATTGADRFASTALKTGAVLVGFGAVAGAGLLRAAHAASDEQVVQEKLNNTLANSPQLAGANRQAFTGLASAVERYSVVGHEAVLSTEAILGQFGLTEREILQLTPLVVDLSRKMGIDLDTATRAVGKAVEGSAAGLRRLGVLVRANAEGTVGYAEVFSTLNGAVGGFAKQEGATFEGQLARIKNQLHDVEQGIGVGVIGALESVIGPLSRAARGFHLLDPAVQASVGRLLTIGTATATAVGGVGLLIGAATKLQAAMVATEGGLTAFGVVASGITVVGAVAAFVALSRGIADAVNLKPRLAELTASLTDFGTGSAGAFQKIEAASLGGERGLQRVVALLKDSSPTDRRAISGALDDIDKSLAKIVAGGATSTAKRALDDLAVSLGTTPQQLLPFLDDYRKALVVSGAAAKVAGAAAKEHAGALGLESESADLATAALIKHRDAVSGLVSALLGSEEAATRVEEADRKVAEAHGAAGRKAEEQAAASRDAEAANRSLTDAERQLADAQRQAPRNLARDRIGEAEATLRLKDAEDAYQVALVKHGQHSRSEEVQKLDLARQSAKLDLADATDRANQAEANARNPREIQVAEEAIASAKVAQAAAAERKTRADALDPVEELRKAEQDKAKAIAAQREDYSRIEDAVAKVNKLLGTTLNVTQLIGGNINATVDALGRLLEQQQAAVAGIGAPQTSPPPVGLRDEGVRPTNRYDIGPIYNMDPHELARQLAIESRVRL